MNQPTTAIRQSFVQQFAQVAAVVGWVTIALRFYLSIDTSLANGTGVGGGVVVFLSYFTVLTNILVVLVWTAGGVGAATKATQASVLSFFRRPGVASAIAVYITVVAVIYHGLLSQLWDPQGLTKVVDFMLHTVLPGLYLIYWWLGIPKHNLRWHWAVTWLSYPVGYSVYTLLLGAIRHKYPYPFSDVTTLGYLRVLLNSCFVLSFFAVLSLVFIGLGRLQARRSTRSKSI